MKEATTTKEVPKRRRGPAKRSDPVFITKTEIARMMCVGDTQTIDGWVADGTFPPPHSQPGKFHTLWLRKHWNSYVETGYWPKEAFPTYR